jgi:nucleoside-diphosphate-sugar epimerase
MKVLITGNKGFVGKYFTYALSELPNINIRGVDIKDGLDCRDLFKVDDTKYDLVIHLAAIVGGRESIEGRPLAVADNLSIDSEFFQWCLKTKPDKVVYFSSSAAYPVNLQLDPTTRLQEFDINLKHTAGPDMTYGWSKLTGEYLAQFVDNVYIFRPFSGYAWDQDITYPFPMYIKRAVERQDPFDVWGTGTQTRDFIHMKDVVSAVLTAVREGIKGPVNLGTGRATSFINLAKMVCERVGYVPQIKTNPDKPVGCPYRVANVNEMLKFYTPKISLEEGIKEAVEKYGKH